MVSSTLATAFGVLVAAAAATPLAGGPPFFRAQTQVTTGPHKFNGKYITTYHVGAGENALVTTSNYTQAGQFQGEGAPAYIYLPVQTPNGTDFYYWNLLNIQPGHEVNGKFVPAAPSGYYYIDANLGEMNTPGFFLEGNGKKDVVAYNHTVADFETFAVCHVTKSLGGSHTGNQLLWRSSDAKADTTGQCADVVLNAAIEG